MTTIKSYTDIEQSKKLAEILPLKSADMYYTSGDEYDVCFGSGGYEEIADWYSDGTPKPADIPCWSLAALLKLIPNFNMFKRTIECRIETTNHLVDKACEPIDAAFEMVCWLKEHNKI